MPGICGVLCPSQRNSIEAVLSSMLDRMRHHSTYREEKHVDDTTGVAFGRLSLAANSDRQPVWNEDKSLCAMMHGEIYNYAEERSRLAGDHQFATASHAELLVHGFEQFGKSFCAGLHGCFAAVIWDARQHTLHITNDRFGMRPLYYAQCAGKFLIASEIKSLLADPTVSRELNLRGVSQFVSFGQFLGHDTLLDSVRAIPGAAWFSYSTDRDRLFEDRYWRFGQTPAPKPRTEAESLDAIDRVFAQAVSRRVSGATNLGISLSGGLDSRTILACVDHQHTPITSISMGIDGSLDHRCAQQMASLVGCRHHSCVLDDQVLIQFESQLRQMVRLTDGHYLSQGIMQYTLPAYRDLGIETLLRGHAGELMHLDKAYSFSLDDSAFAIRDDAGLENWLMRHLSNFMVGELDVPILAQSTRGDRDAFARLSLREAIAESECVEDRLQRMSHIFVTQRLRRETALSMVEFGSIVETRLPFLDNDLVDLLLTVPIELKRGDKIQQHILRRHEPRFLDVVNANTGMRVGAGRTARKLGQFRLKLFAKLRVPGYQPYERLGLWLRRELRPLVERVLLSERCLGRGLFNPDSLRKLVADHCAKRKNHTYLIMALLVVELCHQEILEVAAASAAPGTRESAGHRATTAMELR